MSSISDQSPWGEFEIGPDQCRYWRIGPLGFWLRRRDEEWQLAEERCDDEQLVVASGDQPAPEDANWIRWACGSRSEKVRISPVMPDRPVVARPAQPFRIIRDGSARIYVSLPVFVRIELVGGSEPVTLTELHTVIQSNTWFGSMFEGQLCYWTETRARRHQDSSGRKRPHIAVAPMSLLNSYREELPLEKICLQTSGLSIFSSEGQLWCSEIKVTNTGPGNPEKLEISEGAPREANGGGMISGARAPQRGGVLSRTFGFIGTLPGI